ncbi:hypothetical protein N7474_001227 [Penicillium riverlandense]|uniref:uncharacterized protein n=1 Tax=Penicillium riverlandense TaxID=1903569 RepID=UPI002548868D|nr:uncharacterized protein N7474_001227 [Penicillium riverlandense]KAJ5832916.1 hypothetical protein N7474_001227 [Penicillium riverlandense]
MGPRTARVKKRHGCMTCKARHVRCDEQKPACGQCTRTGRKCDGYNVNVSQRQLRQNVLDAYQRQRSTCNSDSRMILPLGSAKEREYISLFSTRTSRAMMGFFSSKFWDYLLPQLSHYEPVVRHAVAAVGAAHQQFRGLVPPGYTERFVLQQYNKSIRLLLEDLSAPRSTNLDLTLITCGLFVCLELLRGDYNRALDHIEAGLNILARPEPVTTSHSGDSQIVYNELLEMFSRLNIELGSFSRAYKVLPSFSDPNTIKIPTKFIDIRDARRSLTAVMNYCLTLYFQSGPLRSFAQGGSPQDPAWQKILSQVPMLEQTYDEWLASFERLVQTPECASMCEPAILSLRIDHLLAVTWTFGNIRWKEVDFDKWTGHFEDIVTLAEKLLLLDASTEPYFSLDNCAIRALQWSATSCRHPLVRRKAIQLLSAYPRQESLWIARRSAKIAEATMNLEEADLSSLPVEQRIPADENRLVLYNFVDFAATKKTHLYVTTDMQVRSVLYIDWS